MGTSIKDIKAIKRGDVTSVLPMIAKAAWDSWRALPPRAKVWESFEDILADGVAFTITKVVPAYRSKGGTFKKDVLFSSFLMACLPNFYIDKFRAISSQSHDESTTFSYDSDIMRHRRMDDAACAHWVFESLQSHAIRQYRIPSPESSIIKKIDAERSFLSLYNASTPLLRHFLISWIVQPKETKFKQGLFYDNAKREFRSLAKKCGFTFELGEFLIKNEEARIQVCMDILLGGYATRAFQSKKQTPPHFMETEEWPIAQFIFKDHAAEVMAMA